VGYQVAGLQLQRRIDAFRPSSYLCHQKRRIKLLFGRLEGLDRHPIAQGHPRKLHEPYHSLADARWKLQAEELTTYVENSDFVSQAHSTIDPWLYKPLDGGEADLQVNPGNQ
jgi:hypothetical protein